MLSGAESDRRGSSALGFGRWAGKISELARLQVADPLSRGGLALLANTGLTGLLGFAYWIVAARLFSTSAVGVAGALVAATTLFAGIGQFNLSGMLMRFLPTAGGKSRRLVLATYLFAVSASVLLAVLSLGVLRLLASPGSPLRLDLLQSAGSSLPSQRQLFSRSKITFLLAEASGLGSHRERGIRSSEDRGALRACVCRDRVCAV